MPDAKLTAKQQRFCQEYLIDCNATQAAIRAGYSKKSAHAIGDENLKKPVVAEHIEALMDELKSKRMADGAEVIEYLTTVLRGESRSHVMVVEGQGEGVSQARSMKKPPDERERLKAAELLGKRHGIFSDKDSSAPLPVVILNDLPP